MFIEFNANPKKRKVRDSEVRAITVATGLTWEKVYEQLAAAGALLKCGMHDVEAVNVVMLANGFEEGTIKVNKGERRPTVSAFASSHKDWYCVLRISGYYIATGNGNYVDIYDYGSSAVYKYWYKPIMGR